LPGRRGRRHITQLQLYIRKQELLIRHTTNILPVSVMPHQRVHLAQAGDIFREHLVALLGSQVSPGPRLPHGESQARRRRGAAIVRNKFAFFRKPARVPDEQRQQQHACHHHEPLGLFLAPWNLVPNRLTAFGHPPPRGEQNYL